MFLIPSHQNFTVIVIFVAQAAFKMDLQYVRVCVCVQCVRAMVDICLSASPVCVQSGNSILQFIYVLENRRNVICIPIKNHKDRFVMLFLNVSSFLMK